MIEHIILLGDLSGIKPTDLQTFVETTHHRQYGGIYPNREDNVPDDVVVARTRDVLVQAGIIDPSPIVLCSSTQERAREILFNCHLRSAQIGSGHYLIIDQNPDALTTAMRSYADPNTGNSAERKLLKSITVISLGSPRGYDYKDQTGIRVCSLPYPITPYPVHPTPDI